MDTGMKGRVVLVTGASKGIGAATARAFGAEQARVAITYHTDRAGAEMVASSVEATGGEAMVVPLRLADAATAAAAVGAVTEHWGDIDVLVANAVDWGGDAPPDPSVRFEDVPLDHWHRMIGANLIGTVAVLRSVLPGMRRNGWGRIVLISSSVAEEGIPGPGPYGTAKSSLYGLSRSLAWEGGRDGILVNVVAPGFTLTETRAAFPDAVIAELAAGTPTRRLSDPDDVARLIVFLGSDSNRNLTGEVLREGSSAARAAHAGG
ncbi:SDR family NAD(P)-dependent oxidoreductase [Nocardia sp. NPDC019395]|uniref:SDR family NAD(P)-dependent oxidoreductase n=1 Tax=Nocardia sp. NPDC019395 TaxID=3154686 RepID=UPI003400EF70